MNLRLTLLTNCFALLLFTGCDNDDDGFTDRVDVLVDLAVPETNVKSMSGFLHGININDPSDSLITSLDPKLLRSGTTFFNSYQRKKTLVSDARQILIISDMWFNGPGKGFTVMPFENYLVYEEFLLDLIRQTGDDVIYDVWNEPDVGFVWTGTKEQFYECFKFTHNVLRRELGNRAIISAPSTHWIPEWIEGFANYCQKEKIAPDIFSYHELYATESTVSVREHLQSLRYKTIGKRRFLETHIKEIQVNEYGYNGSQHSPAMIFGYLYNLEKGEADGACRACWREEGISTCWNGTIGGLLKPQELLPRASWWTHKLYAESIDSRVTSSTSVPYIASFAYQHQNTRKVIIANSHVEKHIKRLKLKIEGLDVIPSIPQDSVYVKILTVPNADTATVDGLQVLSDGYYQRRNNHINIVLDDVHPLANYVVEIN